MERHKQQRILLFALSVVLLLVVSARISPGEAGPFSAPKPAEDVLLPPSPAPPGEDGAAAVGTAAGPSAAAKARVRALFPDASPDDWNLRLVNDGQILPAVFVP